MCETETHIQSIMAALWSSEGTLGVSSTLFETGSLVHGCMCQTCWPVSFLGFSPVHFLSHCGSSNHRITDVWMCAVSYLSFIWVGGSECSSFVKPKHVPTRQTQQLHSGRAVIVHFSHEHLVSGM